MFDGEVFQAITVINEKVMTARLKIKQEKNK